MNSKSPNRSIRIRQALIGVLALTLIGLITFGIGFNLGQSVKIDSAGVDLPAILTEIKPAGLPPVYGAELGISYDDITPANPGLANQTIEVLSELDQIIELTGSDLDRYIDILFFQYGGLSCEFCCGVPAIIFDDGRPACACEHSFAMRGLTKYLITEHGQSWSDEEILIEAGKWKVLFFPEIHAQKAAMMETGGVAVNYISLTANVNRGLEQGVGGGMIGDC